MHSGASERRTRSLALVVILAVVVSPSCSGPVKVVDLYVDPQSGDDANQGSSASPYRTLTHALQSAAPGMVIHLAAGTYDEAGGEVWPTQTGSPPAAEPNVPDGVSITTDGAAAVLTGPGGVTNTSALVFAGVSTVTGVAIDGFLRGVLVGPGADVVLDEVDVTGSAREGVLVHGDGRLDLTFSNVHENLGAGIAARGAGDVTIYGTLVRGNATGVIASESASVALRGSDVFVNGSVASGGQNSGVLVLDEAEFSVEDALVRDNAYAGIYLQDAAKVTVGKDASIHGNYVGVAAENPVPSGAILDFDGAKVWDNDFEGVYWGIPMAVRLSMRDTEVIDNGDNAILMLGDAFLIDLGAVGDPGGNSFVGNAEPYIVDGRPARVAADGTVITVSYADTLAPCAGSIGVAVGPAGLSCNGVNVISILQNFNRVEVIP